MFGRDQSIVEVFYLCLFGYLVGHHICVFICTDRTSSTISYKFTSFSSSEIMHLSACVGLAITIVVVSPNDSVL